MWGCFLEAGTERLGRVEGKLNGADKRYILNENRSRALRTSDWAEDSLFNRTITLSTKPR